MAEKSKGGGGFFWFIVGLLFGIALTLAALLFLNAGPVYEDEAEGPSTADAAAASAVETALPADPAQLPPPAVEAPPAAPRPVDAGIDPSGDDQIADDAAAAGMTSRTPSTPAE